MMGSTELCEMFKDLNPTLEPSPTLNLSTTLAVAYLQSF